MKTLIQWTFARKLNALLVVSAVWFALTLLIHFTS